MATHNDVVDPALLLLLASKAPIFPFLIVLLVATLASVWFFPGGVAWALTRRRRGPIPGPSGFVFDLAGGEAHRALARLARQANAVPLMAFSVGWTRFVVSSSPEVAREILGGAAFADRPVKESAGELLFHRAMGFAPSGDYWRFLRRVSAAHIFGPRSIAASGDRRADIGERMIADVEASMRVTGKVGVRKVLHYASLNSVMSAVFERTYDFGAGGEAAELEELVGEGYELLGVFNWGDHFPFLGYLDLQGVRRRCRKLVGRVNNFVGKIIDEHRRRRRSSEAATGGDFVDVLLDLQEGERLSDSDMIVFLWEMIFRGTDTVAILLEWIMARMVLHPEIQSKAQAEIDAVVGGGARPVEDADVPKLPYLQAIVKETLRLHPPGPLLSWARLAIRDIVVGSHVVPEGTTAMVNMWAIGRDEANWPEPGEFRPERFMEEDVSVLGSDLRLAPFGSGRRVCPGKSLGLATVHLWLAQLLQSFRWQQLASGDGVDLSEVLKMSMEMKNPLVCCAVAR